MITDIPTSSEFEEEGKELLALAWGLLIELLIHVNDIQLEDEEDLNDFWKAAKRQTNTAITLVQQGVEFLLKGAIATHSPYLLLAAYPQKSQSPYIQKKISFSTLKTIDARQLIVTLERFSGNQLPDDFKTVFSKTRTIRNHVIHSVADEVALPALDALIYILFFHNHFFPNENWIDIRSFFLFMRPEFVHNPNSMHVNNLCKEFEVAINSFPPAVVRKYFNIEKNNRPYICPQCWRDADHVVYLDTKLARLTRRVPECDTLYCPVCDLEHKVVRKNCPNEYCEGNVFSKEELCLTCGWPFDS